MSRSRCTLLINPLELVLSEPLMSVSRTCAPGVFYYIVVHVSVLVVFKPNFDLGGRSKQPVKYATFDESDSSDF